MSPRSLRILVLVLTAGSVQGQVPWAPGMGVRLEYRELAGTLAPGPAGGLILRAEGTEYRLVVPETGADLRLLKPKATAILRGFAGTASSPTQPDERWFWPVEATIRTTKVAFPDPTPLWRAWLSRWAAPAPPEIPVIAEERPSRKADGAPGGTKNQE